jgi:2-polyprenyl-3-methyl-5-hydroxy-6-metoxy-1,4-benzoquinol methylase
MKLTKKDRQYFHFKRTKLVDMLPSIRGKVLDIGCAAGGTLEYLKSKGASYTVGIDTDQEAIRIAEKKNLDLVFTGNVEKDDLPFLENEFDCIIMADILEHLYNPWETLKKITYYLKNDGYMLLSIPNIKHYYILTRLILYDEWSYCEAGILDNTHIRFFTLKETKRMLDDAGLKIVAIKDVTSTRGKMKILNTLLFNTLRSFISSQYYIVANKK